MAIRNIPNEIVSDFVSQIYYNFHANTPVLIAASPLSSALIATPRLFKIAEVNLVRRINTPNMVYCLIEIHPSIQASLNG